MIGYIHIVKVLSLRMHLNLLFSARENRTLYLRELVSQVKGVKKSRMSLKRALKLSVSGSDKAERVCF